MGARSSMLHATAGVRALPEDLRIVIARKVLEAYFWENRRKDIRVLFKEAARFKLALECLRSSGALEACMGASVSRVRAFTRNGGGVIVVAIAGSSKAPACACLEDILNLTPEECEEAVIMSTGKNESVVDRLHMSVRIQREFRIATDALTQAGDEISQSGKLRGGHIYVLANGASADDVYVWLSRYFHARLALG